MSPKYYLKPTVQAEPLIWQWYAWSHLTAPAAISRAFAPLLSYDKI